MTSPDSEIINRIAESIRRGEIPDGVVACRPFGAERPGQGDYYSNLGDQHLAGEEDQTQPGWDDLP